MEQICGYIERITFCNSENGYTVAQLKQSKQDDLTCVIGFMPGIQPGETVRCFGQWKNHLIHGRQFEVSQFRVEAPADVVGIRKYLGSGLIKGICELKLHRQEPIHLNRYSHKGRPVLQSGLGLVVPLHQYLECNRYLH